MAPRLVQARTQPRRRHAAVGGSVDRFALSEFPFAVLCCNFGQRKAHFDGERLWIYRDIEGKVYKPFLTVESLDLYPERI